MSGVCAVLCGTWLSGTVVAVVQRLNCRRIAQVYQRARRTLDDNERLLRKPYPRLNCTATGAWSHLHSFHYGLFLMINNWLESKLTFRRQGETSNSVVKCTASDCKNQPTSTARKSVAQMHAAVAWLRWVQYLLIEERSCCLQMHTAVRVHLFDLSRTILPRSRSGRITPSDFRFEGLLAISPLPPSQQRKYAHDQTYHNSVVVRNFLHRVCATTTQSDSSIHRVEA